MFIPTISKNDALKQARMVLKSIVSNVDFYDFDAFFENTVYKEGGVFYMKGSKEVFEALELSHEIKKVLARSIQLDMKDSDIRNIEVIPRKDHVYLKCKHCYYIVKEFSDYLKAKPSLETMKHFKNYNIVFDYASSELNALGGKFRERNVTIIKYEDGYSITFTDSGALGKFTDLEDARRFLDSFYM